jgi:hypothetical protein
MQFLYAESDEDQRQKFALRFTKELPGHDLAIADGYASACEAMGTAGDFFDAIIVNMGCAGLKEQSATSGSIGGIDIFEDVAEYRNSQTPVYFFGEGSADAIHGMLDAREIDSRPAGIFTVDQEDALFAELKSIAGNFRPVFKAPTEKGPGSKEPSPNS